MTVLNKLKVMATIMFAGVLTLTSCSDDVEQSSFSIDSIEGRAKIIGNITYNTGQDPNNQFKEKISPAAGKKVYVNVAAASLSPNGEGNGYFTYETTTNEAGNYEIEIPAVQKGAVINIKLESFTGKRYLIKSMEGNTPTFEETEVVFHQTSTSRTVYPNDIIVADYKYGFTERDIDTGFTQSIPLTIKVGVGQLKASTSGYYRSVPYFGSKAGLKGIIAVTYFNEDEGNYVGQITRNYAATTNGNGELIFNIPAREKEGELQIELKMYSFVESRFSYYTLNENNKETQLTYEGVYQLFNNGSFVASQNYGKIYFIEQPAGVTNQREARMVFTPFKGQDSEYSSSNYSWSSISLY